MRVLIVSLEDPRQLLGGATQRTAGWAMAASQLRSVDELRVLSLVPNSDRRGKENPINGDGPALRVVQKSKRRSVLQRGINRLRSAVQGLPPHLGVARSADAARALSLAIDEFQPDIVQLEQLATAHLAKVVKARSSRTSRSSPPTTPAILFSAHNLEHRIVRHQDGMPGVLDRRNRRHVADLEQRLLGDVADVAAVDGVVAVTTSEAEWFQKRTDAPVFVVPNAIHLPTESNFFAQDRELNPESRHTVLFCGHLGYPPNEDAAVQLLRTVAPLLQRQVPGLRVLLAGRAPSRKLRKIVEEVSGAIPVELLINPPDNHFLQRASALVCPLRHGAGSRIKLLEAAANALPIVCTPFAAEGLALKPGDDFLAGETPIELARETARVLGSPALRTKLSETALATVTEHHNWDRLAASIGSLYEHLLGHDRKERGHEPS